MKRIIIILACCTTFLLLGYVGYRGYKVWKREHLISMARGFISKSDDRNAVLCLRQILSSNPANLQATRLMADIAANSHSPTALLWRSRIVELNPRSAQDRLSLAQTALIFNDFATATNALAGMAEADRNTAAYHNSAGAAAIALGHFAEAEKHFAEAARVAPADHVSQVNLEAVRIHGTNFAVVDQARAVLQGFVSTTTNGQLRCQALRELIWDAARFRKTDSALSLSEELLRDTNSVFGDNLLRLNVLKAGQSEEFKTALANLQQQASQDPGKVFELGKWESITLGDPAGTLAWLGTLRPNVQTNQNVMVLAADSHSMRRDWQGLLDATTNNWHELEFMRHAMRSRALRGQDLSAAAKTEWEQAGKSANYQLATLKMLLRFAVESKWEAESEELLWVIVNRFPNETWAAKALTRALYTTGRTRPLMMLFSQELKSSPSDLDAKNNLATTAMLLEASELKPYELAREVYQTAPTNASYASTYAFSLYRQEKYSEALKVIEQLTPQQLEKPSIAGYYGLILTKLGNASKAKPYLEAASKAMLLPEERKLFDQAKAGA